jgi:transcriptional regulator with XRE-family HTH domain
MATGPSEGGQHMARKQAKTTIHRKARKPIGLRGDRIRLARQAAGITQWELARQTDIYVSAINRAEAGSKDMTGASIVAIAKALGVTSDYLLGLSSDSGRK